MNNDRQQAKWDARYSNSAAAPCVAKVLSDYAYLLPEHGTALDLACGLGGNALLLAQHGLNTRAWDISPVAIEQLRHNAAQLGLSIQAEIRDLTATQLVRESFDVIVVSYFLQRDLAPAIIDALKTDGLLYYQTFTQCKIDNSGPSNPAYLLAENELLHLFKLLQVVIYQEDGLAGDTSRGLRNQALLVARKQHE